MTDFLASLGPRLLRFRLTPDGVLHEAGAVEIESPVHYVWPHPRRRVLYVAASGRWHTPRDDGHLLRAVALPPEGAPDLIGAPVPLPSRPIHLTLDREGRFVLILFNAPAGLQVRALNPDGSIGGILEQDAPPDVGVFPHQVLVSPDNRSVLVVARGNNAREGRPEDPGGLRRFAFADGQLRLEQVVAPGGGYGFGPRHAAFHPRLPCLYVSVERQNQLHLYELAGGAIAPEPAQVFSTLAPGKAPEYPQLAGTVHVDPEGRHAWVANRDDPHEGMEASHVTGDNTLAAFPLDPATGRLGLPVHSETDAYHIRTFSLAPPLLVAASQQDVTLPGPRLVPASLTVFGIGPGGQLERRHRHEVPTGPRMLFWCGFPAAYGADWDAAAGGHGR